MVELKVRRFGNALGVVLPDDVIARLRAEDGGALYLIEAEDGGYQLMTPAPGFEAKMGKAEEIISRYGETLQILAQ